MYSLLTLFFWSLVVWLWLSPSDDLIGQPLGFYGLLFFLGGFLSASLGLTESHESIKNLISKNKILLLMILLIILISLFPPDILEPYYPPAPAEGDGEGSSLIPIPIGLPQAHAACPNRCIINVCTRWVPGPSPQCPHPGSGGGCCLATEERCDPNCEDSDPPPPPPSPPSINGTVTCNLWGNNSWCRNDARLVLTASDPQGYGLSISGNAVGPFSCSGSCTINLPAGAGTANYTVTASGSGLTDSGSSSWKYDPQPPSPDLSRAGTAGLNDWYVSPVHLTATGSDTLSGLADVSLSVDGGPGLTSATLGDGTYTIVVTAVDDAGNAGSITTTISVDTIPPALMASTGGESGSNDCAAGVVPAALRMGGTTPPCWYVSPVTISSVSADVNSGMASTRYRVNGGAWQAGTSVTVSVDGTHTVDFTATDNAGNTATTSESVRIDQTAPSSSFTSPAGDSEVAGTVQISGRSIDETSGLAAAEISFDDQTWHPLVLDDGDWTYAWDTTLLPNGTYTALARGTDLAGNREGTARLTLVVANLPPKVELPPSWMIWDSVPVQIQPRLIPLDGAQLVIHDPSGRSPARRFTYGPGKLPGSFQWDRRFGDGTLATPGSYRVLLEAWDVFGNSARDAGSIVIPDGLTPTPSSTPTATASPTSSPAPRATRTQTVAAMPARTPQPETQAEEDSGRTETPRLFWPLIGMIGGLAGLSAASLSDPRPRALRRLGTTMEEIIHRHPRN